MNDRIEGQENGVQSENGRAQEKPAEKQDDDSLFVAIPKGRTQPLVFDNRLLRVDGFDSEILRVTAIDPRTIHVEGRAEGVTILTATDAMGIEFFTVVEVTTAKPGTPLGNLDVIRLKPCRNPLQDPKAAAKLDPELVLKLFEGDSVPEMWLMIGGDYHEQPDGPAPWCVSIWEDQHADEDKLNPMVQSLIARGDGAAPPVNKRLKELLPTDRLTPHLILALRSVGNTESVPILFKLLERMPGEPEFGGAGPSGMTRLAATSALWNLTGRKHVFSPRQWQAWWQSVEADFVPARDRQRLDFQLAVTADRVNRLVNQLATDEITARERLVALGPAAVPHLLAAFSAVLPKTFDELTPVAVKQSLFRLAWVIDELGATEKLPHFLRREYFIHRFATAPESVINRPIEEIAACRAIGNCSLADFCSICLAVDRQRGNQQMHWMSYWISSNRDVVSCRLRSKPKGFAGPPLTRLPYQNFITLAADPTSEVAGAAAIIIQSLKDGDAAARGRSATLAEVIGFSCDEKPAELIVALRDAWLLESDDRVRSTLGLAMARFGTPFVLQAISEGLRSDRLEIVSEAAGLVDWAPFQRTDETEGDFDRLIELTHHENNRLRYRAVRSLRGKAPSLLENEFDRLVSDTMVEIRKECAYALRSQPDPKFAEILFKLADDQDEQVRIEAFSSLANLKDPKSMERLLPYLHDEKIRGYAVSALAQMGDGDAVPLLMFELQSGNDVGGMIYQHLVQITHERLESKPEPWIAWWRKERLKRAAAKRSTTDAQKDK